LPSGLHSMDGGLENGEERVRLLSADPLSWFLFFQRKVLRTSFLRATASSSFTNQNLEAEGVSPNLSLQTGMRKEHPNTGFSYTEGSPSPYLLISDPLPPILPVQGLETPLPCEGQCLFTRRGLPQKIFYLTTGPVRLCQDTLSLVPP